MSDFQALVLSVALTLAVLSYSSSQVGIERAKVKQLKYTVELAKINGCKPIESKE